MPRLSNSYSKHKNGPIPGHTAWNEELLIPIDRSLQDLSFARHERAWDAHKGRETCKKRRNLFFATFIQFEHLLQFWDTSQIHPRYTQIHPRDTQIHPDTPRYAPDTSRYTQIHTFSIDFQSFECLIYQNLVKSMQIFENLRNSMKI